jgi:UTP--glucose-1-phosphate uridylyltransferase
VTLRQDLDSLGTERLASLAARGFKAEQLIAWAALLGTDRRARNQLTGRVAVPPATTWSDAPAPGDPRHQQFEALGRAALARGELAVCVLAGGMATRMGGVVKALVEALPGRTFLDLRLAEQRAVARTFGMPHPLWLMTSPATHEPIRSFLGDRLSPGSDDLALFPQLVSLRLTPEGRLFLDDGKPSEYAPGHGDLPEALAASGLLDRFIARGGKYVWLENLDNLGAMVDAALLGWHIDHGGPLSVEVVDKAPGDRGGGPVLWNDKPIITEEFRLPPSIDPSEIPVFNTNTFLVGAEALRDLHMDFTYVEVEKQVGDRKAIQFERLLGEITVGLDTRFVRVPREGERSRFLPVKDHAELERRRPELDVIAGVRGLLTP